MMPAINPRALFRPTILLALSLMAVIAMMILPMPAFVLDIGLAASFALAILIFTTTLFIEHPLDFSSFPTVLLASLMLRLSLNVSSTKLIIGAGHKGTAAAGRVIEGFANFIMGGSVLIGLVIFGVLLIVNFIVITRGAGRMAEVGARFALDAMPGKQLAIDSDMSAGAIDHQQARARREREQAETTFFGSLDGASKFVKGDAVAGLLITLLNLLVGLTVGTTLHAMPLAEAFKTYAILTVGDGLVSQIPAVIISTGAGLLLARGGGEGAADHALFRQLGRYPPALATVALLMALFALVPGLPLLPFLAGALALGTVALRSARARPEAPSEGDDSAPDATDASRESPLGDLLDLDDLHLEFAADLVGMVLDPAIGLEARIASMRRHVAESYGLILPEIRLTDSPALAHGSYVVRIQGVELARDTLHPDRVLALLPEHDEALPAGEAVNEPVYGAPARWLPAERREEAALAGATVVTPVEVLATHLLEVIRRNLSRLMTAKALRRLLDELTRLSDPARAEANRNLFDEMIPEKVPLDVLLAVLRLLLAEGVSVRNLGLILEAIAEIRPSLGSAEAIAEHVRQRLGFQITAGLRRADGMLPLIQLAPEWEEKFAAHEVEAGGGANVALPPAEFNRLAGAVSERLREAAERGEAPALVTSTRRRRFLRTVLSAKGLTAPVLSFEEVGTEARPALLGVVAA